MMSTESLLLDSTQYLASLRDGREVYIYGERVADVTTHPSFRNSCRSIARLYDALHDPKYKDVLTTVDSLGHRTHKFFKPSTSAQELFEAREALITWARLPILSSMRLSTTVRVTGMRNIPRNASSSIMC